MLAAFLFLPLVQLAVASANCVSNGGPSLFEYDIEKLVTYQDVPRNLVAGWRQYGDRKIYRCLNSTVMSKNIRQLAC